MTGNWKNTTEGTRNVKAALRTVMWLKYSIKDEKIFGFVYSGALTENVKGKVNVYPIAYELNGIRIAANVYTPVDYNPSKKYPAVTVATDVAYQG